MHEAVIETRGLRKRFGSKLAVSDLSLTVRRGEVFGFLGPNGAGKTTSLKMLLGLVPPTGGEARLFGRPVSDRHVRSRVGFLPEHFRFHDWLNGREFLRFHGRLQGMNGPGLEKRIEELLVRVDLVEAAGRKLREYSKGMLQRIGLAQALVHGPELVFLDEPTSGLDPLGRLLVRDIIKDLRAGGTAVFLNSHLLGEVEATCDRVVFIKAGRVIREMVMGEAETGIEVELRLAPMDERLWAGLADFGELLSRDGEKARLKVADDERLPEIAAWLTGRGTRLYEMRTVRRSLESLFLEVMGDDGRPG
jgi:ABC-2 type transport system ATP-binding protein